MSVQEDLFAAKAARDVAMARVSSGPWLDRALGAIRFIESGWSGTGEALRLAIMHRGCPAPHHHNAWGPLVKTALTRGLIRRTGQFAHMQTKKSHARLSPVYVRT